jgi:peroxiredoxin (alkyl hydroperoxide reductase subunit C)
MPNVGMKTVGDKLLPFKLVGVKPGQPEIDPFFDIDETSFEGKWKIIVFYPKDFTFVCPTEITEYDSLNEEFEKRNAVLLTGSTDNEFCKLAWQREHPGLGKIKHVQFADTQRGFIDNNGNSVNYSLCRQLGIFFNPAGACLRATFIVDPFNVIQHVTVNDLSTGRSAHETLRVLDAIQTEANTPAGREIGGCTL